MKLSQRFALPFVGAECETDLTVFSLSLRFVSDDHATFDLSRKSWEELGEPRKIIVTVEVGA